MLNLPWRQRGAAEAPRHDPRYANRLDALLTPAQDFRRGVRVGHEVLGLLETGMDYLDFEAYYLQGAVLAAHNVILNGSFYPQAGSSAIAEQAAEVRQRTVGALEHRLKDCFSGGTSESPHTTLRWAATYVALTGEEFWDKDDAAPIRTEIAPQIRRGIDAGDEKASRIVAHLSPHYRIVFEEDLLRSARKRDPVVGVVVEDLLDRTEAAWRRPAGFTPFNLGSYTALLAAKRVMEAVEIRRTPGDPSRGIDIIDPLLSA